MALIMVMNLKEQTNTTVPYDQAMTLPVIPVVLGSADYSKFAPQNSYIDVSKFDSAKDLAEYLLFVGSDAQAYNSYFEWKESYRWFFKYAAALIRNVHLIRFYFE